MRAATPIAIDFGEVKVHRDEDQDE